MADGGKTIPYDAKDEFFPGVVFTVQSLLSGQAPFWNPYVFSGYPSFADPQAMTFSPSVVLPMLLSQSVVWFDFVILLHVLFGGIGVLRLGRSYAWTNRASVVAALVFMFGGVASSRLQHTPMIVTWAFVPWMFVAIRALFEKPSLRAAAGLGTVLGFASLQLTQMTYLTLLALCAYGIFRLCDVARARNTRSAFKSAGLLAVAAVLALAIAGPQIVATLSLLPHTNRAEISFEVATINSLSPVAYATLVSPNALGNLSRAYIGPNDITETYFYVGAFPFALLLGALFGRKQCLDRGERLFWTLLIALSIVYTLGRTTPVYFWLYEYLPGVHYFRRPSDAAFLFVFCATVLIGASIDTAPEGDSATSRAARMRMFGVLVCLLFLASLSICAWFGTKASLMSLAMLVVAFFCYARVQAGTHAHAWFAGLALSIFVDVGSYNLGNRLNAHDIGAYSANISLEQNKLMNFLAQRLRRDGYFRVELRTGVGGANAAESMRIPSIAGLDPLVLQEYVWFIGIDANPLVPRRATGAFDSYHGKLNDLLGVRYLAANGDFRGEIKDRLGASYHVVADMDGYVIWENEHALPRLLRPQQALPAPAPSAFTPNMLNAIDLERFAYIEAPSEVLTKCNTGRANGAEIASYSNNEVAIDVQSDRSAWIVLNDVYFEWWRAEISGEPMPIYRANGIFRAVCVPPGRNVVRFLFEPYRYLYGHFRVAFANWLRISGMRLGTSRGSSDRLGKHPKLGACPPERWGAATRTAPTS